MKPTTQVIMGATLVMAASLAIVLALVLVLLAELYCSLLLRRSRRLQPPEQPVDAIPPPPSTAIVKVGGAPNPLGVLDAPRSLLLSSLSPVQKELLAITSSRDENPTATPQCQLGLLPAPPSPALTPLSYAMDEHLVYISNPIYDDGGSVEKPLRTPFETPDTSPSRMESVGDTSSSDGDGEIEVVITRQVSFPGGKQSQPSATPPLSPMRKLQLRHQLQLQPSSVSLYTSESGYSNSNNGVFSSTPGATPCTSPSW
ncbi:hypothetical protein MLD38_005725 [Melastoma candidum]|uniref:Uncharacterized protein n=1 Tax=Melastoma candidum TaxID=119954 RepID=A0ACB9RKA6_9MYRT|nr:hypothetical protein MLD38_005725 [Melastoma candidum]